MSAPFGVLFVFHFVTYLIFLQTPFHKRNYHRCVQQQRRDEIRRRQPTVTRSNPKNHANGGQNESS
jgi:hypothetical protein